MKKFLGTPLLVLMLVAMLAMGTAAADFENSAYALNELGLFQGTDSGFDLDREPTRAEAAVMLTRMLGQESHAQTAYDAGEIAHPFTDTDPWMDPYIAYLYENGYTTGATNATFEPEALCSDQMYVTFVLRALGYFESDGDFAYADAVDFATGLGLVDGVNLGGDTFLRDNVAAVTYTALSITPKDSDKTLYERLLAEGVVPQGTATGDLLTFYQQLNSQLADMGEIESLTASGSMTMKATVLFSTLMTATINLDIVALPGEMSMVGDYEVQYNSLLGMDNLSTTMASYVQDGWHYTNMDGVKTKSQTDGTSTDSLFKVVPLTLIDGYGLMEDGAYALSLSTDYMGQFMGEGTLEGMALSQMVLYYYLDNGTLTSISGQATLSALISGVAANVVASGELTLDSVNTPQTIDFPSDLDSYIETGAS